MTHRGINKLDARSLRGLAHPLRVQILGMLRVDGSSTASRLAKRLDEDSGNVSWHLRQLAAHGFIAEDPQRGTKRERWWQALHKYVELDPAAFHDDEVRGPFAALQHEFLELGFRRAAQYLTEDWSREWREATEMGHWWLRLTPQELTAVIAEVRATLDRYEVDEPDSASHEGERDVFIQLQAFPFRRRTEASS
jgi:DNA-binding transcriptional ArsR family regulator